MTDTDIDLSSALQLPSGRRSQQRSRSQSSNNSLNEPGNQVKFQMILCYVYAKMCRVPSWHFRLI